jgi:N-acetylglucosamine-6-sulfatase
MTMRSIQIALMVAVSLLALGGMRLGTAQPATPNIIFILTDDLNADLIEFMPNLKQQLVAQGTTLKNFFVNVSLCCPSRANILRGQYAHNTQILTNLMPTGGFEKFYALGHESSTVATWLQAAGYRTCYLGKYLNGYPASVSPPTCPPAGPNGTVPLRAIPTPTSIT